jgi:hypothetical protein
MALLKKNGTIWRPVPYLSGRRDNSPKNGKSGHPTVNIITLPSLIDHIHYQKKETVNTTESLKAH